MKKFIQSLILPLIIICQSVINSANAQVTITGSNGNANGTYEDLRSAFTALNYENNQTGKNIFITINAAGYSGSENSRCRLDQPHSNWTSLKIIPIGNVTISGISNSSELIDFEGADNVIIDGLNSEGNSLTISNPDYDFSGTSTIRFRNDASNNTITNCNILGSSGYNGGTIFFDDGKHNGYGNDNNTISNCNIGPAGSNLPVNAVFSLNHISYSPDAYNSGNIITNCNIYDYFNINSESAGIYISYGNTDWTITNNKLYQTSSRTQNSGHIHSGIQIANTGPNNSLISGNTIGFSSRTGTGSYNIVVNNGWFYPIYLTSNSFSTINIIGNTIKNINVSNSGGGTGYLSSFKGIYAAPGDNNKTNISGNIIGSSESPGSITYSSTSPTEEEIYGIHFSTPDSCFVSNNRIGGITGTYSNGRLKIYGIRVSTYSSGHTIKDNNIDSNIIGFSSAPIINNTISNYSAITGIYSELGTPFITKNKVSNLVSAAVSTEAGPLASITGIRIETSNLFNGFLISQNEISSLSNISTLGGSITGIFFSGQNNSPINIDSNLMSGNIIQSLNISSSVPNQSASLTGIYVKDGSSTFQNNFISLGFDNTGSSVIKNIPIYGINEQGNVGNNIYHNSVYIGGSGVVSGSENTFCFKSSVTDNSRSYRNNIFCNARTNGAGTGSHFAIGVGGSEPNPEGLTIDNNVYYTIGIVGGVLGFYNSIPVPDLSAWKTAVGMDEGSLFGDPQFINPVNNLHINPSLPSPVEGNGFLISSVPFDIDGEIRSALTPVDIGADAGNFIRSINVNDIKAASIIHPPDTTFLPTPAVAPKVRFKNTGASNLSNIPVTCSINPGGYFSTKIISFLNSGDSVQITFDSTFIPAAGSYNLITYSGLVSDQSRSNDTLTKVIFYKLLTPVNWLNIYHIYQARSEIADSVSVELREPTTPYNIINSSIVYPTIENSKLNARVLLSNTGSGSSYYIVLKNRNSLETWSANTVAIGTDSTVYDFTTSVSQAFGNNMILTGGLASIYSGDINQDGTIELSDVLQTFNDASSFTVGNSDLNGDGITDLNDLLIVFNNTSTFIHVIKP